MKALERYIKKNGKDPYGGSTKPKGGGKWKGPKSVSKPDQFASKTGKPVVDDSASDGQTEPDADDAPEGSGSLGTYASMKANKKKSRSYLDT